MQCLEFTHITSHHTHITSHHTLHTHITHAHLEKGINVANSWNVFWNKGLELCFELKHFRFKAERTTKSTGKMEWYERRQHQHMRPNENKPVNLQHTW